MTYQTDLEKRLKLIDKKSPPLTNSCEILLSSQTSSEPIAKFSNRAKVGAVLPRTQLPSKITGGGNVIYLNSKHLQNRETSTKNRKTECNDKDQHPCEIHFIPL